MCESIEELEGEKVRLEMMKRKKKGRLKLPWTWRERESCRGKKQMCIQCRWRGVRN